MKRSFITLLAAGMVSAAALGGGVAFADSKNRAVPEGRT